MSLTSYGAASSDFRNAVNELHTIDGPYLGGNSSPEAVKVVLDHLMHLWPEVALELPTMKLRDLEVLNAVAMGEMDDFEYMNYTLSMLKEIELGNVKDEFAVWVILAPNEDKQYFCAINYQDPVLRQALQRVEDVASETNAAYIDSILDGDAIRHAIAYYKMARSTLPPSLQQLKAVGKHNRYEWTKSDEESLKRRKFDYSNGPESWQWKGLVSWVILAVGLVLLSVIGILLRQVIHPKGKVSNNVG